MYDFENTSYINKISGAAPGTSFPDQIFNISPNDIIDQIIKSRHIHYICRKISHVLNFYA